MAHENNITINNSSDIDFFFNKKGLIADLDTNIIQAFRDSD